MLSYESGKQLILENVQPLEIENRPLSQSRGYALAGDIIASHPVSYTHLTLPTIDRV